MKDRTKFLGTRTSQWDLNYVKMKIMVMAVMIMYDTAVAKSTKVKCQSCRQMYLQVKIKLLHTVGFFFVWERLRLLAVRCLWIVKVGAESWFIAIFVSIQPEQASFDSAHILLRHDVFFLQGGKLKNFLNPPFQRHSFPFRIYYGVLSGIRMRGREGIEYRECAGNECRQRRKLSYLLRWNHVITVDKNMGPYWTLEFQRYIFVSKGFTVLMAIILNGGVRHNVTWWVSSMRMTRTFCFLLPAWNTGDADKSLARPGRKQARKHVRDARDFNNVETRAVIKFLFLQGQGAEGNSRHSDWNISLFPSLSG